MYLVSGNKIECYGCEACVQVCPNVAIFMLEDNEGFRYPNIEPSKCMNCGMCLKVCPYESTPEKHRNIKYVFGGYNLKKEICFDSTSGGAFSAIVDKYCDENYVIFGVEAKGLVVFHNYITDKLELGKFRKSKYSQSIVGYSYRQIKKLLKENKEKVLFSGTPCQVAGLKSFLGKTNQDRLLTIEVVCEGVPSPLYIKKYEKSLKKKYGDEIQELDYRYTGKSYLGNGKWDFQIMKTILLNKKQFEKDRWFNPFWSIWLNHFMSRPSCYNCQFAEEGRIADITLGDLWGVHLYCPELYGNNNGVSLIVANTNKGYNVVKLAESSMFGHELEFDTAIKYQSPMRKPIATNEKRKDFMSDLASDMSYKDINKKWAKKTTLKLFWEKYIWGNRQKVFVWKFFS